MRIARSDGKSERRRLGVRSTRFWTRHACIDSLRWDDGSECICHGRGMGREGFPSPRFGEFVRIQSQLHTGRKWADVQELNASMAGKMIWLRARKYQGRASSKKLCFVTLRQQFSTVQCVVAAGADIPVEMSQFVASVPNESVVDVLPLVAGLSSVARIPRRRRSLRAS